MQYIAISEDEFAKLREQLEEIQRRLQDLKPSEEFWDNADVIQKLKVSERTLCTWREEGLIRFSKVRNKVYYRPEDVEAFLDQFAIEAKKSK